MCLCWNPDGSMCVDMNEIRRRIDLSMDGRWKLGVGEVPKGEGTVFHRRLSKKKKVEYNEQECSKRWQEHIANNVGKKI